MYYQHRDIYFVYIIRIIRVDNDVRRYSGVIEDMSIQSEHHRWRKGAILRNKKFSDFKDRLIAVNISSIEEGREKFPEYFI